MKQMSKIDEFEYDIFSISSTNEHLINNSNDAVLKNIAKELQKHINITIKKVEEYLKNNYDKK